MGQVKQRRRPKLGTARAQGGSAWRVAALSLVLALGTGIAAVATAEVTLTTRVQKIEQTAAAAGQPQIRLVDAERVYPGEVLRYTIEFRNESTQDVAAGSIVITNPLPEGTEYVAGSAAGLDTVITFSVDGEHFASAEVLAEVGEDGVAAAADPAEYRSIRWSYQPELPVGQAGQVSFDLLIP